MCLWIVEQGLFDPIREKKEQNHDEKERIKWKWKKLELRKISQIWQLAQNCFSEMFDKHIFLFSLVLSEKLRNETIKVLKQYIFIYIYVYSI